MSTLLQDYLDGVPGLLEAYAGLPSHVSDHPIPGRPWDEALVLAMQQYQSELQSTQTLHGTESVIITGQQPGIFTGPLYTIYKAITAIKLARAVEAATGETTVPIYWVGGDDHDFDEVRKVQLLSRGHTAVPLALENGATRGSQSIYQIPVPEELHALTDQAARQATGSELAEDVRGFLHESLDASSNLSEWHARLMARLFRDTPLLFFTPELPAARRAAIPIFEQEIRNPLSSTTQVNAGGDRLEAAGYGAQVVKSEDSCNFFLARKSIRCRVRYTEGAFYLPDTAERYSESEMLELLHREPELFTANVALRCVVQQHLFPVRAYVAGPGELAYWGQLKGMFASFGQPMPIVYPRSRAVLTTLKTNKLLRKFGLSLADLNGAASELEERALRTAQQDPAIATLDRHRAGIGAAVAAMEKDFHGLGRSGNVAAELAAHFRAQVHQGLAHMERRLLRADETRTNTIRSQIGRLTTELSPDRKPQERYYTIFSWLFQHGWELIPRIAKALDHNDFSVQEVEL